jgi:hypothetical protein
VFNLAQSLHTFMGSRPFYPERGVASVKPWLRTLVFYTPGIALFVAGVIVLLTIPLYSGGSPPCVCTGPPGSPCSCPAATLGTLNPTGPLLLFGAGVYSLAVFGVQLFWRRRFQPEAHSPLHV